MTRSSWNIWRIPLALAALMVFGLLAALLGTGAWHWAAWLALALPLMVGLWHACRRRPAATHSS
ncbi:MAG TPA: hypothetical protein VGC69_07050 [Bordetella sp.]